MSKRSLMITVIAAVIAVVAILSMYGVFGGGAAEGDGSRDGEGGDAQEKSGGALRPITFMLDWTPNVNHVGIFVADAQGYFAAQGLEVDIVQPGEVYPAAAVLSGRAHFGVDYQEYLTLLSNEQRGLVSIAAMLQSNTSGFATLAEAGIESIADFASLTYGSFSAPFEEPTLQALLECHGASAEDIEYVPAGTDILALLTQGRADMVWIFYGTQGFQAQEVGVEIDYFPMLDYTDCIPDYYTPIIIAAEEYIAQEPQTVRAFVAALDEAYRFIIREPQRAADILADAVPELNRAELRRSVPWLTAYMQDAQGRWGRQEASVWREYAQWMRDRGLLTYEPTTASMQRLFTNEYLPRE